jgi:predicted permease
MLDVLRDLKFGARALRIRPGFTAVAIVSLGLGIGLNTSIFSIINAVFLRPTSADRPEELVRVYTSKPGELEQYSSSSYPDYVDLREGNEVFSALAAHSLMIASVTRDGVSEIRIGEIVTANYFDVLGIGAFLGRTFLSEDDRAPGEHPVAVLSHGFWRSRFGGDPDILGGSIRIDGLPYSVIGVVPPSFTGMTAGFNVELWVPMMMADEVEPMGMNTVDGTPATDSRILERGRRFLFLLGRMKEGVSLERVQTDMSTLGARLSQDHPDVNEDVGFAVVPAGDVSLHPMLDRVLTPIAMLLMGVVGVVLLIACANVANMLLAKATSRRKEIALRLAIGAGRARLVRQLLTESLLLSGAGGLVGLLLSLWTTRLIQAFQPPLPIHFVLDLSVDFRVLVFTLFVSFGTGLLFGLVPAFRSARTDLVTSLKETMDGGRAGSRFGLGNLLVVGQVASAFVLLLGAGLLLRGLMAAQSLDLGFEPARLGVVTMNPEMNRYDEERSRRFYARALERIRSLPGVSAATAGTRFPLEMNLNLTEIWVDGHELTPDDDSPLHVDITMIDDAYFHTLNIPILEGRGFLASDTAESVPVVIVNEALARRFWPDESAIGKRVRTRWGTAYEIVGTARNHKVRTVGEDDRPYLHFVRAQRFNPYGSIVFRTRGDPSAELEAVRRELLSMEPSLVIMETSNMAERMALSLFTVSAGSRLLAGFGLLSVLLATVGLYGLIAYWVSQRTREIGIRIALGADRDRILGFVVKRGMLLAVAGVALGIGVGALVSNVLESYLYGVRPMDPLAFIGVSVFLLLVSLLANALPAWRAASVDPNEALRHE